jgi:hypothetical protein
MLHRIAEAERRVTAIACALGMNGALACAGGAATAPLVLRNNLKSQGYLQADRFMAV